MIKLKMKNYNTISIEKQLKYESNIKHECLTGEEIWPSNQQQIIEQVKFTYSPLGKAFEKEIKTNEDQGEKQIKAMQDERHVKTIIKYNYDDEDSPIVSKQKEIFN